MQSINGLNKCCCIVVVARLRVISIQQSSAVSSQDIPQRRENTIDCNDSKTLEEFLRARCIISLNAANFLGTFPYFSVHKLEHEYHRQRITRFEAPAKKLILSLVNTVYCIQTWQNACMHYSKVLYLKKHDFSQGCRKNTNIQKKRCDATSVINLAPIFRPVHVMSLPSAALRSCPEVNNL
jgi:hypothetical protein